MENPEIMCQGKTLRDLVENIKDAYYQMTLDEVPADYSPSPDMLKLKTHLPGIL